MPYMSMMTRPQQSRISKRFKAFRLSQGLSQEGLAKLMGVMRKTVCNVETRKVKIFPGTYRKFLAVLAASKAPKPPREKKVVVVKPKRSLEEVDWKEESECLNKR